MEHTCYTAEMCANTSAGDNDDDDVFIHPSVPRSYIQPSRVQKGKATW
jgi:hypothetical protein